MCNDLDWFNVGDLLEMLLEVAATTNTAVDCWVQGYKQVCFFSSFDMVGLSFVSISLVEIMLLQM